MMKKHLTLSISNPCPESWENFKRTKQGGFCARCQKEVIDFTSWSEEQIKDHIIKNTQPLCGRFKAHQLKTYKLDNVNERRSKLLPLSLFSMAMLFTTNQAEAAEFKKPLLEVSDSSDRHKPLQVSDSLDAKRISGVVRDESGEAMPGVNVVVKIRPIVQ